MRLHPIGLLAIEAIECGKGPERGELAGIASKGCKLAGRKLVSWALAGQVEAIGLFGYLLPMAYGAIRESTEP